MSAIHTHSSRVGIIYVNPNGSELKLLLVLETPSPEKQKDGGIYISPKVWKMPGGKLEQHDRDIRDCITRETEEETGFITDRKKLFSDCSFSYTDKSRRLIGGLHTVTTFLYITSKKDKICPGDDIEKVRWFRFSKIPVNKKIAGAKLTFSHREYLRRLFSNKNCQKHLRFVGVSDENIKLSLEKLTL